jgi:hypothetical protein
MVSGITWPNGDPFLQRQNEPSIAASSRNPLHLLAGANDYRSVDLQAVEDSEEHKDAWLGVFKSFNGGQTWTSTLLPGCPYETPVCTGAPLSGKYQAASDPVVRAGTNGMFYYSGIAFQRNQSAGVVFVARYIDNNNKENGDPIQYLDTSIVSTGGSANFLDKPWIAVDVPRPGALTCEVNGQSFLGGNVYLAYANFPISDESHAAIQFSRSRDCGATWSKPIQIVDNKTSNQGPAFAIDHATGTVYLAWRQYTASAGAIFVAKSTDGGASFGLPVKVANLVAFDQETTANSFRTSSYPSLTTDAEGRVYIAWSDRVGPSNTLGCGAEACARIVVSSSTDGLAWTGPQVAEITNAPGHQWMPALTFSGGLLSLIYYDSRYDHYQGVLVCPLETLAKPEKCTNASQYVEKFVPTNDDPGAVFTPGIVDTTSLNRRHTIDVRAIQSSPGWPLDFGPSVAVTQYLFGSSTATAGGKPIDQLRYDAPNVPMFASGTEPFLGDYIDITPVPAFLPVVTGTRSVWRYNADPATGSVLQAAWTDNRDVIPPRDQNWQNYTPPEPPSPSVFAKGVTTQSCTDEYTGTRNQNIYTSRIASGVVAGSLGNSKQLSSSIERGFVVFVENTAKVAKTYRLAIPTGQQPPGGYASFVSKSTPPVTTIAVEVPAVSSIARTVFVTSSNPRASLSVVVTEIAGAMGLPVSGPGTQTTIQLNPDLTNPDLTNPDLTNPSQSATSVLSTEIYTPDLTNVGQTAPDLTNPDLTNPDLTNPDLTNPDITNTGLTDNKSPTAPDLTNPDLTNPDLTNAAITSPDLTNGSISDTFYQITNNGNTAAAFDVKLVLKGQIPEGIVLQLLLYRVYTVPAEKNCSVISQAQNQLVANILNPAFTKSPDLTNPDLTNGSVSNATLALAPGETARIDIRTASPSKKITFNPMTAITVVAVAQSVNSDIKANPAAPSLPAIASSGVTVVPRALPAGNASGGYVASLQTARSGVGPVTWSVTSGKLPPGLTLDSTTGVVSGIPALPGTYTFTATATSNANPLNSDSAVYTIVVGSTAPLDQVPPALVSISFPVNVDVTQGPQNVPVTITATDNQSGVYLACYEFEGPSGGLLTGCGYATSPVLHASLNGTLAIPQFATSGAWTLSLLYVYDYAGNLSQYATADLAAKGLPTTMSILGKTPHIALTSLSFNPSAVNVTTGPQTVAFTLGVDDTAGAAGVIVEAIGPNSQSAYMAATETSGTAVSGAWKATLTIPQNAQAGTWSIYVYIYDLAGNSLYLYPADLLTQAFPNSLSVASNAVPPVLTGITVPSSVNTTAGAQTVNGTLSATDASGITLILVYWVSPSSGQYTYAYTQPSAADALLGTWPIQFTLPQNSQPGIWTPYLVELVDASGLYSILYQSDLTALGISASFTVVSNAAAPLLTAISIPSSVNTSAGAQTVNGTVSVKDTSGITAIYILWLSPSGTQETYALTEPTAADMFLGTWPIQFTLPQNSEAGVWKPYVVELVDGAGLYSILYQSNLAALGISANFTVQ